MEDPSKALGPQADGCVQKEYLAQFNFIHWATILQIVLEVSGPALDKAMLKFNDMTTLVSKSISVGFSVTDRFRVTVKLSHLDTSQCL